MLFAQVISLDDPDEHVGLHSNHISDQMGCKVMHIFVQNGLDNEYWGPLTFEERLGFLMKDFPLFVLFGSGVWSIYLDLDAPSALLSFVPLKLEEAIIF